MTRDKGSLMRRPLHLLALVAALVAATSADVIFQVPEVLVRAAFCRALRALTVSCNSLHLYWISLLY